MAKLTLIRQQHPEGCGVAVFAMLTGRTWEEAVEYVDFEGRGLPQGMLRVHLERDGYFCRSVYSRRETGGIWPPPPFAPRHFANVVQPSGGGHLLAVEEDGTVLDPMVAKPRRLDEWQIVHELVGLVRN